MRQVPGSAMLIGDRGDVRIPGSLRRCGVGVVVDLAMEELPITSDREMVTIRIPLVDGAGNTEAKLALAIYTVAEMMRMELRALVVCSAGLSRSPAITAGAISCVRAIEPGAALELVRRIGPADIAPDLWAGILRVLEPGRRDHWLSAGGDRSQ